MTTRPFYSGLATLLLLAGCVTTLPPSPPPGPFPSAAAVSLGADNTPAVSGDAGPGAADIYRLTLPADLVNTDRLLYAEAVPAAGAATDALSLTLFDSAGAAVLSSSSADFFGPGGAPSTARAGAARVGAQAIRVAPICRGPCVLARVPQTPNQEDVFYVRVEGTQTAPYALYLFTGPFADTGEPINDARNTAVTVTGSETGALETLGDEDFYRSSAAATRVTLSSSASALSPRAEIFLEDGTSVGLVPVNQPFVSTLAPQRFLVRVFADARRAAVAGDSTYTLTFK